ncbi:MAG TPA: ribonuclease Z [Acidimicrobiales bacterium]|jgi:ribonuclease BN (tRNA processing enzyme)|nr:ribonuclease Z [Acidimicrobiales bacterium]
MTELTFLGTGNFMAPPGRYWNSFVLDTSVLVEPSPIALPHLRRCGFALEDIAVVVVSHFHADHCFGWPFLLGAAAEAGGGRTLHVVGPPGIEAHLRQLNESGAVGSVTESAYANLDLRFVEVDGTDQQAGPLRFRAVEVVHVPYLRCFGYLFDRGDQVVGYTGDVTPCAGLTELAESADVLVLECNGRHTPPGVPTTHMDEESVRAVQAAHPDVRLILTHLGEQVDLASLRGVTVPDDFERLRV